MSQTKEKHDSLVLSRSDLWVVWRSHGITCLLLFLFRTNSNKGHLDQNNFHHCYGYFFLKVAFWKLLDHSYIPSPLSTVTRHTDNNILKDTLQFYILWTWINMHTISFIKTVVNVTETRIDGSAWKKVSSTKIQVCTWKNIAPKEKACFTYFMLFFFSET